MSETNSETLSCGEEDALKNLLISWGIEDKLDILIREHISIDILKILTEEHVKELTQNWRIGDKAQFIHHFTKWRHDINHPFWAECSSPPVFPKKADSCNSSDTEEVDNVNMLEILQSNKNGERVLQFYEKNKFLTDELRVFIINIAAQHFARKDAPMTLQASYKLETQILSLFPTEKLEFYRTERRGKIYVKSQNLKKQSKQIFMLENESPTASKKAKITFVPEENGEDLVQVLKYDKLSAEEFETKWISCANYRLNQVLNECSSLREILKKWPEYKSHYKLIDIDFSIMHKSHNKMLNWDQKILKLFNFLKKSKQLKCHGESKMLETLQDEDLEKDRGTFAVKTLWILHYVLFPTGRQVRKTILGKKEISRYTIKDSQKTFLFLGKTLQELHDHIDFLLKMKEHIQPFILGIGSLDDIHEIFVYFDGDLIRFPNFLRSLDICFKMFHLFNLQYPTASETFWIFLENYFFEISSCSKKKSKVSILLDDLEKQSE
ncbi:uncharacterized protein LOC133336151 [Musca vetustissima]|uniref:uncharacterized protein LOC133336151 n=1 Tax=Musca vetustissima TaxID=27455 RepID=UPI002AB7EF45|nr:uncharacterized protein LOC133336015 isoform X2 [Musca vetustissima]XP_061400291.1 uncharacterized protein LOC133336015 isoform X2 [Musca vetustissima]XP_061400432.1 uncharacterized protein LOC133336151 [Musca vetustissima]